MSPILLYVPRMLLMSKQWTHVWLWIINPVACLLIQIKMRGRLALINQFPSACLQLTLCYDKSPGVILDINFLLVTEKIDGMSWPTIKITLLKSWRQKTSENLITVWQWKITLTHYQHRFQWVPIIYKVPKVSTFTTSRWFTSSVVPYEVKVSK